MSRWALILFPAFACALARAEILTPPYFNLAEGKEIFASATCGVDTPGPELYCKLVGGNADPNENINLIQGQVGAPGISGEGGGKIEGTIETGLNVSRE